MKPAQSHAQNAKLKKTLLDLKIEQTAGHQDELMIFSRGELFASLGMDASERRKTS